MRKFIVEFYQNARLIEQREVWAYHEEDAQLKASQLTNLHSWSNVNVDKARYD